MREEGEEDVANNKAPKAQAHYDREKQLEVQAAAMKLEAPEVENEVTGVPRSELMAPVPKPGKDVDAWKPGKENVKSID